MVAVEIDKRVKEALTGDAEYKLGDLTKRAVKSFTRKENYEFGDVSREVMRRFEEPGADAAFGADAESTAIDSDLAEELDRWDARFLAARDADADSAKDEAARKQPTAKDVAGSLNVVKGQVRLVCV